jgi:tellurite resistance-related uncharacterized protein
MQTYLFFNSLKLIFYKNKIIQKFVGEFPKKEAYFPSYAKENNSKILFFINKGFFRNKPKTIEDTIDSNFSIQYKLKNKKVFVGLIKNARIISKNANVITYDNLGVNEDVSALEKTMTSYKNHLTLPKLKKINSRVLAMSDSYNYFHYMFEILPRLNYIKKSGLKTDYYLLSKDKKFKKDAIKALNISENKIIDLNEKTHLKAKEVLFSSMPIYSGNPTKEVCQFLRKLFLKKYNKSKYKKYEKIYVMRGNVKYRKVLNEKEVIDFLEKKGFTIVEMDGLSVFEQAEIFNSAKVIVASHGAALTNLVFCKNGTKLIEIFNPSYVNVCYWALSNCVKLDYYYFLSNKKAFNFKQDLYVNINKLEKIIDLVGV